jgi:hypothetical protein
MTAVLQGKCKDASEAGATPSIWWQENVAWTIGVALLTGGRRLDSVKTVITAIEDDNNAGLRP